MPDEIYNTKFYRPLKDGELIQYKDVVLDDLMIGEAKPIFAIGPNHPEIGNAYEEGIMNRMLRKKNAIDRMGDEYRFVTPGELITAHDIVTWQNDDGEFCCSGLTLFNPEIGKPFDPEIHSSLVRKKELTAAEKTL